MAIPINRPDEMLAEIARIEVEVAADRVRQKQELIQQLSREFGPVLGPAEASRRLRDKPNERPISLVNQSVSRTLQHLEQLRRERPDLYGG